VEASTRGGVHNCAHVLLGLGWLRYREERGERVSREAGPGVGEVRSRRMLRAIPWEHMSVSGEKVRGRGHIDRVGFVVWFGDRMASTMVSSWSRSGLRVYWRHTTKPDGAWVWWLLTADVNVLTLGGARCGAPPPGRGGFCNRWLFLSFRSTEVGTRMDFKVGGVRAVGWTIFKTLKAAPCCVYRLVSLRIE
jgi:hypothetical protein